MISIQAGFTSPVSQNRLIATQSFYRDAKKEILPKNQFHQQFFKVYSNFLQALLECKPLGMLENQEIFDRANLDPKKALLPFKELKISVTSEGIGLQLIVRFGLEP